MGDGDRMSEPIAFPRTIAHSDTATDPVLERLATWLAEVSAEHAHQLPSTDAEPPMVQATSP